MKKFMMRKIINKGLLLLVLSVVLVTSIKLKAQTIEGTSGLFFIPTAEMHEDKQISIGASYVDKSLISFSGY